MGCVTKAPFKQVELHSVNGINPIQIKKDFAKKIPNKLQVLSTVSFEYYWHSFYSLGYFERDLIKNSFTLVALDPAGVRLFQITDNDDNVEYSCSIEELKKLAPFAEYISRDIKNIYFNDIPSNKAIISKEDCKIIFTESMKDDKIEYIFGGINNYLIEKVFLKKRSWFWRIFMGNYYRESSVGYYGYKTSNGKLYPENILYKNIDLNYQLTIRLKDIML